MQIQVFGRLTDIIGSEMISFDSVADTDSLISSLEEKYPGISASGFVVAVNKKQVVENTSLDSGSTIVLMPPFSGG